MARRRYRTDSKSDAAKVHGPDKAPETPPLTAQDVSAPESAPVLRTEPTPEPAPPDETTSNLKAQLDQMRHVQFAQKSLENQIDALGDLSVAQRAYLRARPEALNHIDILAEAHKVALHNGLQPDSPQYFAMLDFVLHALMTQSFASQPPVNTAPPAPPQHIEIDAHVEKPAMDTDEEDLSHMYSAPPSRGLGVASGGSFEPQAHQVTLSAAEREAARASGVDELEYARNKIKLSRMKQAGLIRD